MKRKEASLKIQTAINRFAAQLLADGKSRHTREAYVKDLTLFANWSGNRDVRKTCPMTIAAFFGSPSVKSSADGRLRSPITINRMKTSIRVFFNYLQEAELIKTNPARFIKAARTARKIPATLTEAQVSKLLSTMSKSKAGLAKRDFAIVSLFLGTGIRLSSLVGLNRDDVLLNQEIIRIRVKGNGEETVFVNPQLKRILKAHFRSNGQQPDAPLFQTSSGRRLGARQVQVRVSYWLKQAGITNASVHTLRHTFATRLYEKTGDLYLVQKALGHKQITATEIYTRVSDQALKRAVCLL